MAGDAREIENLLYRYAERIDLGDLEGVADLFAHGRVSASPDAPKSQVAEGREQVLTMYRNSTRLYDNGTPHTKHVTTNAIIEVDSPGERASARSYYTVLQQVDDLPLQPIISGRYHDSFRRVDGCWWFDTRVILVDLVGNLGSHLLFELD